MPDPQPLRIFLSYACADVVSVRDLYHYLRDKGFDVWFDEEDLVPGQDWQFEIKQALNRSDVVIACFSQTVVSKEGLVQKEFRFALDLALEMSEGQCISLIPVRLQICSKPLRLNNYHWLDLFEREGYRQLVRGLKRCAEQLGRAPVDETQPLRNLGVVDRLSGGPVAISDNARGNIVIMGNGNVIRTSDAEKQEKEDVEKKVIEQAELERSAAQRAKQERLVREKELAEKVAKQKAENERMTREKAKKQQRNRASLALLAGVVLCFVFFGAIRLIPDINLSTSTPTYEILLTQTPTAIFTRPPTATAPSATFTPALRTATSLTHMPSLTGTMLQTPTPAAGNIMVSDKDGMRLHLVPAGPFLMGSVYGGSNEKPVHSVTINAFWIDETEITNRMYALCVTSGVCKPPYNNASSTHKSYYDNPQYADYPAIHVYWKDAQTYCAWAGRALPSEAQWEKAARGADERTYPWGNDAPNANRLNYNRPADGDTSEVGSYPEGASPYGALDMAGNVWEWVNDWYDAAYYDNSPDSNPLGPASGEAHGLRGGSWNSGKGSARSFYRSSGLMGYMNIDIGFRCALTSP